MFGGNGAAPGFRDVGQVPTSTINRCLTNIVGNGTDGGFTFTETGEVLGGGGGGGGGSITGASNAQAINMRCGSGGGPGGGGGGACAGSNQTGVTTSAAGGNGGDGACVVVTYFS
jgi:hypothetical protein